VKQSQTEAWRYRVLDRALTAGVLPDTVLRAGSRYGAWARERRESVGGADAGSERLRSPVQRMSTGPIAEVPEKANEPHYELPPEFLGLFLGLFLGPRRKYSGCPWEPGVESLAAAEEAMLALTCARAVTDGIHVLDLGCGRGSLSVWLAARYPACSVVGSPTRRRSARGSSPRRPAAV
jgi:cyclopropane-fatty-acyl-phospholipid synthase